MAGGRKAKPVEAARPQATLVLDNGAHTIKAGVIHQQQPNDDKDDNGAGPAAPILIPNCIARDRARTTYVGAEIDRCRDYGEMQFRRPVEKGFIVNWEAQKEIWDRHLFRDALACDPAETRLVLAEPPNGVPALQANCDQVVFEEYGFASYFRGVGPAFNAYHDIQALFPPITARSNEAAPPPPPSTSVANVPAEAVLVIDAGYSHTTVTPVLCGRPLHPAVRRLDIGGKVLTNYLTRLVSMRHFDMRSDAHIVDDMKQQACFVSADFPADLEACWKGTRGTGSESRRQRRDRVFRAAAGLARDYVLPDFRHRTHGVVRDFDPSRAPAADEDVVTLRNERFAVPELLFRPSAAGLVRQPGLPALIAQSLSALPEALWPALTANVLLVGGGARLPGFAARLEAELAPRLPSALPLRVTTGGTGGSGQEDHDPVTSTWRGAAAMAALPHRIEHVAVSKQEYEELGAALVARRFAVPPLGP